PRRTRRALRDEPRLGGEMPSTLACAPRTRGWTIGSTRPSKVVAVSPAHAGMDQRSAFPTGVRFGKPCPRMDRLGLARLRWALPRVEPAVDRSLALGRTPVPGVCPQSRACNGHRPIRSHTFTHWNRKKP